MFVASSAQAQVNVNTCPNSAKAHSVTVAYNVSTPINTNWQPVQPQEKDIVDTAVGAGSFNTLVAAVKAAGLVEALKGDGPFTVFAPTDEAFKNLPEGTVESLLKPENKDKLAAILKYHVVSGKVMAGDVLKAMEVSTLEGSKAKIGLTINGANVVKADIGCSNGVIHVIDAVILPPEKK